MPNSFESLQPSRDYITVYSDGDHYYITWDEHLKYIALYGNKKGVHWIYPEDVLPGIEVKGLPKRRQTK